ncbi:MAG: hypothetical protein K9N55_13400, partial [Phycisphaerae bacterium]|nr:hypothetical protein [Phycisphaerae bacterium]
MRKKWFHVFVLICLTSSMTILGEEAQDSIPASDGDISHRMSALEQTIQKLQRELEDLKTDQAQQKQIQEKEALKRALQTQ